MGAVKWAYVCSCQCICVCRCDTVWEWTLFDQFKPVRAELRLTSGWLLQWSREAISGLQWIGSNVWIKWVHLCVCVCLSICDRIYCRVAYLAELYFPTLWWLACICQCEFICICASCCFLRGRERIKRACLCVYYSWLVLAALCVLRKLIR